MKNEEIIRRLQMNIKLIDNLHQLVMEGNLQIENKPENEELIKELNGLVGKTRDECIEYLDKHVRLRSLCIALYPVDEE